MKADKLKIMIVDDNAANLKLAGDLLEIEGFEVSRCIDAEKALETLAHIKPDLILMDLALPGIDGLQLTRKLKVEKKTSAIKIVALTASAMKGDKERILAAGCDGYIAKPIDTRKFKEQILEYLDK
jgi:CheY-like chemotaxis protein